MGAMRAAGPGPPPFAPFVCQMSLAVSGALSGSVIPEMLRLSLRNWYQIGFAEFRFA